MLHGFTFYIARRAGCALQPNEPYSGHQASRYLAGFATASLLSGSVGRYPLSEFPWSRKYSPAGVSLRESGGWQNSQSLRVRRVYSGLAGLIRTDNTSPAARVRMGTTHFMLAPLVLLPSLNE